MEAAASTAMAASAQAWDEPLKTNTRHLKVFVSFVMLGAPRYVSQISMCKYYIYWSEKDCFYETCKDSEGHASQKDSMLLNREIFVVYNY